MDSAFDGHAVGGGLDITHVRVDMDGATLRELDGLPNKTGAREKVFTADEDDAIWKYWPTKIHNEIARVLGMSPTTALKRYRFLKRSRGGTSD